MANVQILTDSCSDMPRDLRERYGIDYCKMMTVYRGEETPASLDWENYSPKELYDIMRGGERVLTTQVPPEEFRQVFSRYLKDGKDIVYVGCCVKQSSSVNTAQVVAKELLAQYPARTIEVVDSLNASMGEGMVAMKAAELRDQGLSAAEIAEKTRAIRNNVREYVTVHSLDALKRAGRVKASAAFFGNLFGVKPIIISDAEGTQAGFKKVKGRETSIREIVNLLKETILEPEKQTIYVLHADSGEDAEKLRKTVLDQIPAKDVYVSYIGPIIGASIGPDALAIFGFGEEVTFRG